MLRGNKKTSQQCMQTTPVGFEPTRGDPIVLAARRLDHSAEVSLASFKQEYQYPRKSEGKASFQKDSLKLSSAIAQISALRRLANFAFPITLLD